MSMLDGNERWKTKMMLTEHMAALEQHRLDLELLERKYSRPILDDEECREIELVLSHSLREQSLINLKLWGFDEFGLSGVVKSIHTHSREIKFKMNDTTQWIKINQIVAARKYNDIGDFHED